MGTSVSPCLVVQAKSGTGKTVTFGTALPDTARHVIDTRFEPSFLELNGTP
jgi:superfamily II DNA/RNA helicase